MLPSLPLNTNTSQPLSEVDPDPDSRKKCWLCQNQYDADKLAEHIRIVHPLIKPFRLTPGMNNEASPSSTGSGSGEAVQAVTEGQREQQVQAQVEDSARLLPYEEAPQPYCHISTQSQTHACTQFGSEAETLSQNQTQGNAEKDTAVNAEPDNIAEHIEDSHHQNLDEHTSVRGTVTAGVNSNSSSLSPPSVSLVHAVGPRTHTQEQARAQEADDAHVQHRAEAEIRTRAQRWTYTPVQSQGRPYSHVRTLRINESRAGNVDSADKGDKQYNGNKNGKQPQDFRSRESSPDGIQKTFQSLKNGGYSINWGGSNFRNADDTSIHTRQGNDIRNAYANTSSMIQKQGRNLNGGYSMNGGGNGDSDSCATSTRARNGAGYGNANRGFENPNLGGNSNPYWAFRKDQRMDIGRLIHGNGDNNVGSVADCTQNAQHPHRQPQAARRFSDGGGGAATSGETEAVQILAQRFSHPRPRKPQPGRLLIAPPAPAAMGPQVPIQSGSSPVSTSNLDSATPSRLKRRYHSDSTEADTEHPPTRTPTTTKTARSAATRTSNSSPQTISPRDAQGRPLTKAGVPRATRGELEAKMPGPDPDTEFDGPQGDPRSSTACGPGPEAWFRAVFIAPDNMSASPPVEIISHQSKPWETFQNELRRASKGVAGRFIEGQENGFGLEHGSWFFTFIGRGTERDGRRVWGELGRHPITYRDMASSVLGDPHRYGVIIMHAMQLSDARRSGRIKVVDGWAEFPDMLAMNFF